MFKVLIEGCDPTRGTKHSACIDLYASEDVTIGAGETKLVGLGVAVDIDRGFLDDYALSIGKKDDGQDFGEYYDDLKNDFMSSHYLQLMLRSSLSKELVIANGVGVIDLHSDTGLVITDLKFESAEMLRVGGGTTQTFSSAHLRLEF